MSSVFTTLLLYGIICQMNHFISRIHSKCLRTSSQISSLINVSFQFSIDTCKHSKAPDIEFPSLKQSRLLNIFLNDKGSMHIKTALTDNLLDFLQLACHCDANASVSILARLNNPHFFLRLLLWLLLARRTRICLLFLSRSRSLT